MQSRAEISLFRTRQVSKIQHPVPHRDARVIPDPAPSLRSITYLIRVRNGWLYHGGQVGSERLHP
jgi:hypothetical protein